MTGHTRTLLNLKITGLTEISPSSLEKLFDSIIKKELTKGENILEAGKICRTIVFVEKGYLRTFVEKDGLEINTDFTFENNFTTNLKSLRLAIPSEVTIKAGENAVVYEFDKDALLQLYKDSPEIESFGRKLLEQLLMIQEEHTNLFKLFSPAERYQYLATNRPEMLQRVSLSHVASYLGVTRETLSRIRKVKK